MAGDRDDHYTFAGEIPWSSRFGSFLRSPASAAERHVAEAFTSHTGQASIPGVPVEVPVTHFLWEPYHCSLNQVGQVLVPAPSLCSVLRLVNHAHQWDLYEKNGALASISIDSRTDGWSVGAQLLYMRQDLVERYLDQTAQRLCWLVWGERVLDYRVVERLADELHGIFANHDHIHERAYVWTDRAIVET